MFDKIRFSDFNDYNDYLTRKLAHYNEWLMDPKRTFKDGPYPGFPEDLNYKESIDRLREDMMQRTASKEVVDKTSTIKREKKKKRVKKMVDGGPTKQSRAVDIYKRLAGEKVAVIQAIQDELGMTVAGATTYFYNAKKLV